MANDRLDQLRDDLWARWTRLASAPRIPAPARDGATVYSFLPRFDLADWRTGAAPVPGGQVSPSPKPGRENYAYVLDPTGRPLASSKHATRHGGDWSGKFEHEIDWYGEFRYGADEIEYVDWCAPSKLPSRYDRLTLRDGCRASLQRLTLNAGGFFRHWLSLDQRTLIARVREDSRNYQLVVERYDIEGGRIVGGESLVDGLGAPIQRSSLEVAYGDDGRLSAVGRRLADGSLHTLYARKTSTSLAALSSELARRIAESVTDALRARTFDTPLAALQLSYRAGDRYLPFVIPVTVSGAVTTLPAAEPALVARGFEIPEAELGLSMAEFTRRIEEKGDANAGAKMLRAAARLLTADAHAPYPRTPDFVAYAIDCEIEGDSLRKILKDCGATRGALAAWTERGWLG
jgi:hypothetical protein